MSKIAIIGCGFVGSTISYTLAFTGFASEIVLIDVDKNKAEGDALDISHGISLIKPVYVYPGDIEDVKGADIIVITAGKNRTPGKNRLELVKENIEIYKELIPRLEKINSEAIYLIVSNPVDILTYVTGKISSIPSSKIIGSGTVLDTSRFRYLLSREINVDPRNIHGYIIGEHGDSQLATWSTTSVSSMNVEKYCKAIGFDLNTKLKSEIENNVRLSGAEVIEKKGATYYAIALAVIRIIECIIRNEKSILPVSTLINGEYGITEVALSLPTIISSNGVLKTLEIDLNEDEIKAFLESASKLKNIIKEVGF